MKTITLTFTIISYKKYLNNKIKLLLWKTFLKNIFHFLFFKKIKLKIKKVLIKNISLA